MLKLIQLNPIIPMKKLLLLIAVLSAASFSFAGGDKACPDKEKCDAKCDKACCKSDKDCKDAKATCDDKADAKKDSSSADAKAEKK